MTDNWTTRMLVQKGNGEELTMEDIRTAKEIFRRKALVGLYSDIFGAARHYARHFGWDNARHGGSLNQGTMKCFESAILEGMKKDLEGSADLEEAREGSTVWREI